MTIVGTSHFVSFDKAARYFLDYGYSPNDVRRKIADGEIHIGKPAVRANESIVIVDDGKRYAIVDSQ